MGSRKRRSNIILNGTEVWRRIGSWSPLSQLPKLSNKKGNRKHIRWKAPPWLKLNFDGACRGNPGVSRFEAVIRN
ncbi:hypothetical protein SUGI_0498780 [Cryptomeria japonica]|nr:hypothetical protein SUGI_0498780 [Cryptomeria japonica]